MAKEKWAEPCHRLGTVRHKVNGVKDTSRPSGGWVSENQGSLKAHSLWTNWLIGGSHAKNKQTNKKLTPFLGKLMPLTPKMVSFFSWSK